MAAAAIPRSKHLRRFASIFVWSIYGLVPMSTRCPEGDQLQQNLFLVRRFQVSGHSFYIPMLVWVWIFIFVLMFPLATHTLTDPAGGNRFLSVTHARTRTHRQTHRARTSRENEEGARCFWPHEILTRFNSFPGETTGKTFPRTSGST